MIKAIKRNVFPGIIALSALSVSSSAAFYSVYGLSKLFAGAQFEVVPLTDSELEDSNPKDMEPQENYAGAYSVKYIDDAEEEHLYNELKGSAFTDQELQGFNIDPNGSVNFVVIINDPDENKEKEIYDKIKNFLTFKS